MAASHQPRVLVVGASIAGPVTAFFLSRTNFKLTVLERAPELRTTGQNIDIRGAGMQVIRKMDLESTVRSKTTHEAGMTFVDENNNVKAKFVADLSGKTQTFTSDVEILRGELANVLYGATKELEGVEYIFGQEVERMEQDSGAETVKVWFKNGTAEREFDLVVAADGLHSKTRKLGFSTKADDCIKSLNQYTAYFALPKAETDGDYARWYNAPRRRSIMLRPDGQGTTRAFLSIITQDENVATVNRSTIDSQKALVRELFSDAGWEAERILTGMDMTDDFYMQETAQVKLPSWSNGRVTVVGDAGYCPSPISGMGTTLAIVGAYVLAGELVKQKDDLTAGLVEYERIMRPFVQKAQKLVPGAPSIANPETRSGIAFMNGVLGFVSWSGLFTLLGKFGLGSPPANEFQLPEYNL